MHLVFAAAEFAPLCQSGGLGDAVSGLAHALVDKGHHVTCLIPGYRDVFRRGLFSNRQSDDEAVEISDIEGLMLGHWKKEQRSDSLEVFALDIPSLFDREGLYGNEEGGFHDNAIRFLTFSRAVAQWAITHRPDVLVAHDHHAAMSLCYLDGTTNGQHHSIGRVQVVHNNAYQGRYPSDVMRWTALPQHYFQPSFIEAYGSVCFLKGGLNWADRIITVSPSYGREIQTHVAGEGLEGLYQEKKDRLSGIANGIDTKRFDPMTDTSLVANYNASDASGKSVCRQWILNEQNLMEPPLGQFCIAIGRLAAQKGWDVLLDAIPMLVDKGFVLSCLGDGDPMLAKRLTDYSNNFPHQIKFIKGFNDALARQLYAGADAMLIPSVFEPCGLVQMIAQRYGTLPVASAVGGLQDTIADIRDDNGIIDQKTTSGVLFSPVDAASLVQACDRLGELPAPLWLNLQKRLMNIDVSWGRSADAWDRVLREVAVKHDPDSHD